MNIHRLSIVFVLLILAIPSASAETIKINGTQYFTTWDGRVLPVSEWNVSNGNSNYSIKDLGNSMRFDNLITISKANTKFNYDMFKIHQSLTYSKTVLINNMVNVNVTVAYLVIPYSLSKVKDWSDDKNVKVGRWLFQAGQEHIDIYDDVSVNHTFVNETGQNETYQAVTTLNKDYYQFRIVNGEIRLYFLKAEANKLQGNITFQLNSWSTNGSTTPAWQNTSGDAVIRGNGYITNNIEVGDYISWWDMLAGSASIPDVNKTSNITCTATGATISSDNIYLDGSTSYVDCGTSSLYDFTSGNYTYVIKLNQTAGTPLNEHIIQRGTWAGGGYYLSNGDILAKETKLTVVTNQTITDSNNYVFQNNSNNTIGFGKRGVKNIIYVNGTEITYNTQPDIPTINTGIRSLIWADNHITSWKGYVYSVIVYNYSLTNQQMLSVHNNNFSSSNNTTHWGIDAGAGNVVGAYNISALTPTNTNYTVTMYDNTTGTPANPQTLGTGLTATSGWINGSITGTKYQTVDFVLTGYSNLTATPEESGFEAQIESAEAPPSEYVEADQSQVWWIW